MNKLTRTGMLFGVLLVGCATGGVASRLVVPPATAQNVQRWDYFCFEEFDGERMTEKAKKAGAQGWELAAAAESPPKRDSVWCFKRPM